MNGKKAKKIRKEVYEDRDSRERQYKRKFASRTIVSDNLRQEYKQAKEDYKNGKTKK